MCGIFVFSVQWSLGLKPHFLLSWLSPGMVMGWPVASIIVHVNSIDVISNLSVPSLNCLFSLRFLNLQATDCDVQLFPAFYASCRK